MGWRETSLCGSRLMRLNAYCIAFSGQIRFNAGAQLKGGRRNEKTNRGFGSGLSDTGVHGGAGIRAGGQSSAAESGGEGNVHACGWQDDYRGLLESAGEGAEDLRWFGAVRRGVAHGGE